MSENGYTSQLVRMGIPDSFVEQGTPEQQHALCGYGPEGILNTLITMVEPKKVQAVNLH
jgi:1-deoxy-D-xylulose-5-phosphate synthase